MLNLNVDDVLFAGEDKGTLWQDKDQTVKHRTCNALTQPSNVAGVCWPCRLLIPVEESVPQYECKCEYEYT